MTAPLSESELAELQRLTQYLRAVGNTLWAHRVDTLVADLAREREARREGERLLAVFAAEADKLGERDWGMHSVHIEALRDARAFLAASPKAGGNEKPGDLTTDALDAYAARAASGDMTWRNPAPDASPPRTPTDYRIFSTADFRPIPPASSSGQAPIPSEAAVEAAAASLANLDYGDELGPASWNATPEDARTWYRKLALPALLAANAIDHPAGEVAQGWQPMESAPEDGTTIFAALLVINNQTGQEHWEHHVIWFDDVEGTIDDNAYQGWDWDDYSHWMPLPAPPLSSAPQPPKSNSGGK